MQNAEVTKSRNKNAERRSDVKSEPENTQNKKTQKENLKQRTKKFALALIKLYAKLPKCYEAQTIGKQISRAGTSGGANYREGCRARSSQEFAAKLGICLQELEETAYWFELLSRVAWSQRQT
ncbi:MAG: four helix bundle protein [Candidatus Sulfobium sp.]|jgi:four helix bundle protein